MKAKKLILLLVLSMSVVVPLSNDIYLAGLPQINQFFHTQHGSWLLSIGLLGLAFSQLFYGQVLDRFGRKPILLFGLGLFILSSFVTVVTNNFNFLLFSRFFQMIGACATIVSSFAIVRDTYPKEDIIKATGYLMAVIGVCPALAPLLGSFLTVNFGWRANFIFLLFLGLSYFFIILFLFKESLHKKNLTALNFQSQINNLKILFSNKNYVNYISISALSYGVLFAYFALSPIFIIDKFHYPIMVFGYVVAINAIAIFATALISPKLAHKFGLNKIIRLGLWIILLGGLTMLLINLILKNNLMTFMLPMFLTTLGTGLIRPTASGGAISESPKEIAGLGSAGYNFVSFMGPAVTVTLSSLVIYSLSSFGLMISILGGMGLLILE